MCAHHNSGVGRNVISGYGGVGCIAGSYGIVGNRKCKELSLATSHTHRTNHRVCTAYYHITPGAEGGISAPLIVGFHPGGNIARHGHHHLIAIGAGDGDCLDAQIVLQVTVVLYHYLPVGSARCGGESICPIA